MSSKILKKSGGKKKIIKKVEKKNGGKKKWVKKVGKKKIKKSGGEKSKQAVVEVASELLFGLGVNWLEIQLFWLKKFSIDWFSHKTFDREKIYFDNVRHIMNSL